jgi:hypothetical protein
MRKLATCYMVYTMLQGSQIHCWILPRKLKKGYMISWNGELKMDRYNEK